MEILKGLLLIISIVLISYSTVLSINLVSRALSNYNNRKKLMKDLISQKLYRIKYDELLITDGKNESIIKLSDLMLYWINTNPQYVIDLNEIYRDIHNFVTGYKHPKLLFILTNPNSPSTISIKSPLNDCVFHFMRINDYANNFQMIRSKSPCDFYHIDLSLFIFDYGLKNKPDDIEKFRVSNEELKSRLFNNRKSKRRK